MTFGSEIKDGLLLIAIAKVSIFSCTGSLATCRVMQIHKYYVCSHEFREPEFYIMGDKHACPLL